MFTYVYTFTQNYKGQLNFQFCFHACNLLYANNTELYILLNLE
jgi:hypothetical protein